MKYRFFVLIAAIFLLTVSTYASAESPKLTFEIIPNSIELPTTGEDTSVLVIVRNPTTKTFHNLQLSWVSNTLVKPKKEIPMVKTLPPKAEFTWEILLAQPPGELVSGRAYFYIKHHWYQPRDTQEKPAILLNSVQLKSRELSAVDKILGVEVKTTLESLNENQPGMAYLVLTNKSNVEINIKEVYPFKPSFICFNQDKCLPNNKTQKTTIKNSSDTLNVQNENEKIPVNLKLYSQQSHVIPIQVTASNTVVPGKYLLVFNVLFDWREIGSHSGNIIVSKEVKVGVFAESEILTLLGIPSLLFLPGVLMLVIMRMFWNWGFLKSKTLTTEFPLQPGQLDFWAVSITISIIIAFVYPRFSKRDYLKGYGLSDVAIVWLISVFLLGCGFYIVLMIVINWYLQLTTPSEDDDQIETLNKLYWRRLSPVLNRVSLNSKSQDACLLEPYIKYQGSSWVAPRIVVKSLEGSKDLKNKINDQIKLNEKGSAAKIAELLDQGKKRNLLELEWEKIDWLSHPQQFSKELKTDSPPSFWSIVTFDES